MQKLSRLEYGGGIKIGKTVNMLAFDLGASSGRAILGKFDGEKINYGTYTLNVLVSGQVESLAVELPQMYSSYRLWINGNEVAHNGKIGRAHV